MKLPTTSDLPSFNNLQWYDYNKIKDRQLQEQKTTKKQSRTQAISQGVLALGCLALGRYACQRNNPVLFLFCLGLLKGTIEEHTAALSQYLSARKNIKILEKEN